MEFIQTKYKKTQEELLQVQIQLQINILLSFITNSLKQINFKQLMQLVIFSLMTNKVTIVKLYPHN